MVSQSGVAVSSSPPPPSHRWTHLVDPQKDSLRCETQHTGFRNAFSILRSCLLLDPLMEPWNLFFFLFCILSCSKVYLDSKWVCTLFVLGGNIKLFFVLISAVYSGPFGFHTQSPSRAPYIKVQTVCLHDNRTVSATPLLPMFQMKEKQLKCLLEFEKFQKQGKDVERVKQRLAEIANYVDKFYRPLNIRVALVGLEVWSDADKCPVSQDPFSTLHEFLDWRKAKLLPQKPHDNAQLISGVYFQGTTIGMAPIMSMCTVDQSGGVVMDHSENPLGAAVTLAHELGHNFGMNHDTPERGCGCRMTVDRGGCIMTPSTGYPFPTVFSSCSKKDLAASLEKGVGMCLYNMPEVKVLYGGQKCGNGYVEEGEECDCGEPEECMNPCCNATMCTLKGDSVCAHGQCCEDCMLKLAGTPCREAGNSCDLPEFCTGTSPHCPANVYLHDGHACTSVDGYCYNGICQTHEQQCITLWGPGATPAPGICFERVNSAGDPYGNCGKDSKGSFAKCEARDAKCGKIQCQGGANRPVIGTNAVSIETNIPLQEGGRILCRGTHVYLGDDMPDPGLVLSGTKCGEGMMCLNRQCQNVSEFGVHECSGKCSGRGVCNNKKNCHCESHWAPPLCQGSGFGGSIDSGPMRVAGRLAALPVRQEEQQHVEAQVTLLAALRAPAIGLASSTAWSDTSTRVLAKEIPERLDR
uniref:ADAM metallopeptidase domain 12 n=1 Tax=Gadus morhua TaxID=8049 RepID=A0A8C5BBI5_GADMO